MKLAGILLCVPAVPFGAARVGATQEPHATELAKLIASDTVSDDEFGFSAAVSGDTAVVGTTRADPNGAAYVFERDQGGLGAWGEILKLAATDATLTSQLGSSIAIWEDTVVAGAEEKSWGDSATAASGFSWTLSGVEGDRSALFFFGANGRQANPWGSGSSFVCVAPPVVTTALLLGAGTPGACDGFFSEDLNARWCPTCPDAAHNPGPGATVQAQLWLLDPGTTVLQTASLSNAMEFFVSP